MKAAIYKGIEDMPVEEVKTPKVPEDGVLVKIKAVGVCGSDLRTYYKGTSYITPPIIIGHEISGVIVEIGPLAELPYKVGDRVAIAPPIHCGVCYYCQRGKQNLCMNVKAISSDYSGGFAEYIALPGEVVLKGCFAKIPENLDFPSAAISELACSVIKCQEEVCFNDVDCVVIIGAGPIGCLHAQLAKLRGVRKVILGDILDSRLKMAEDFGPDVLVNTKTEDLGEIIKSLTGGRGADLVIAAAPSVEAASSAVGLVAKGGKLILFAGFPKDDPYVKVDGNLVHYRDINISGTIGFAKRHQELALQLASEGKINLKDLITDFFPLDGVVEAIEKMKAGKALKAVVLPQKEE